MKTIRGKSVVLFQRGDAFLFTVCYDAVTRETFYIPVGGGIEFGEYSWEAAKREVWEEISQEVQQLRLLDVEEAIFTFNGVDEHEIVFIYQAEFKDKRAYTEVLKGNDDDKGRPIRLAWANVAELNGRVIKVYPFSLTTLLNRLTPLPEHSH